MEIKTCLKIDGVEHELTLDFSPVHTATPEPAPEPPSPEPGPVPQPAPEPPPPSPVVEPPQPHPTSPAGWMEVRGNQIYVGDTPWMGRGANIFDTRSCGACMGGEPDIDEAKRRVDVLVDDWGASFVRLCLESRPSRPNQWVTSWENVLSDPAYLAHVRELVEHIGTKPGVRVLLSIWTGPSLTPRAGDARTVPQGGWPTEQTAEIWRVLAETFKNDSHVMYGIVNEPQMNFHGTHDAAVHARMQMCVDAIREVEAAQGTPNHVIAVQGTGGWARFIQYYVENPIRDAAEKIIYECHFYNSMGDFERLVRTPKQSLPVVVGEVGPASGYMTLAECRSFLEQCEALGIPYLGWAFHMRCPPNMFEDRSGGGCGTGMEIVPNDWGRLMMEAMSGGLA